MRIALLPIDERPTTGGLAAMVGAVAGATVALPPEDASPAFRRPGDTDRLGEWLTAQDAMADAHVVALETLGLGGLVPSRTGHEPVADVVPRWHRLRSLRAPVHASCIVTRTPDADDPSEEPEYFGRSGRAVHAASAAFFRGEAPDLGAHADAMHDFVARRLRNHTLNLTALGLAADHTLATLVIGADDTAVASIGTAEQDWLRRWCEWLRLDGRVLSYPGADEVAAVLVCRAVVAAAGGPAPRVRVHAACGLERIASYENVPVDVTAAGQLRSAGAARVAGGDAELHLVVHPPAPAGGDFATDPPGETDPHAAAATAALVGRLLDEGRAVAVADCAYANGADPQLFSRLRALVGTDWSTLAGYAAWNTAGNTLGTALATGLAVVTGQRIGTYDRAAHDRLLRHRLLEDWGWMSSARGTVRAELGSDPSAHDHLPAGSPATALAARLLAERLAEIDPSWRVAGVRFPWQRTFEVDFEVRPA